MQQSENTVTVSGTGQINATPDVMHLDLGVQRTDRDLNAALNDANADIARIKDTLTKHGVKETDIQTSQLAINQHYGAIVPYADAAAVAPSAMVAPMPPDLPTAEPAPDLATSGDGSSSSEGSASNTAVIAPVPPPTASAPAAEPAVLGTKEGISSVAPNQPNGYDVLQTLAITLRSIADAGATISDAAAAGGNATRINGVSFAIDDNTAVLNQARDAAFADAKAKAEQYAKLAGRSLGKVSVITEGSTDTGGGVVYPMYATRSQAAGSPVPISAGSQQVTVTNTVVWQLN
jgi:uncharacterized protein YggE